MNGIKLSIIIPVYNTASYLKRCLDSVLAESVDGYEVILVNDGSTDESEDICKPYLNRNSVRYYYKSNGGLSDARNFGLQKATGDYLWFIDSDDYVAEGSVARVLEMLKTGSDVIVCLSQSVDDAGNTADECRYTIPSGKYSNTEYMDIMRRKPDSVVFCAPYHICRRSIIEENHLLFYKGIIHEDELWTPQILLQAQTIYYSEQRLYYHYMRAGSITHNANMVRSGESCFVVVKELLKTFNASSRVDLKYPRDRMADLFLEAVWKAPAAVKSRKAFPRSMPLKNAYRFKTRVKAFFYFLSPEMFLFLYSGFKRLHR